MVSDFVAASSTGYSRVGFSSTPLLRIFLTSAPRNCCWRSMRSVSLPFPIDLRARTYPSASSPSSFWRPAGSFEVGVGVVDRLLEADLDAVHGVHHVLEAR